MKEQWPEVFWMILVEGSAGCQFQHRHKHLAEEECKRLAIATGKRCFLLEAVAVCAKVEVEWKGPGKPEHEDIPF